MDKIEIKGLEVFAHHGVYEEEQRLGQKFVVTVQMYLDTEAAGQTDDLEKTVNYGAAARTITAALQEQNYRLLETAAQQTAQKLLFEYPLIRNIRLRIEKPWAPVGLPLDTAAVEIERGWHRAYIAMGSNLGDMKNYIEQAMEKLRSNPYIRMVSESDLIVTEAYGYTDQPDFLNGCAALDTMLSPERLLDVLQELEQEAGRERKIHWGPRTLDLDMLMYDDLILGTPRLILPHPEIEKRSFVLKPMTQIAPWLRHPVSRKTMSCLLEELENK